MTQRPPTAEELQTGMCQVAKTLCTVFGVPHLGDEMAKILDPEPKPNKLDPRSGRDFLYAIVHKYEGIINGMPSINTCFQRVAPLHSSDCMTSARLVCTWLTTTIAQGHTVEFRREGLFSLLARWHSMAIAHLISTVDTLLHFHMQGVSAEVIESSEGSVVCTEFSDIAPALRMIQDILEHKNGSHIYAP